MKKDEIKAIIDRAEIYQGFVTKCSEYGVVVIEEKLGSVFIPRSLLGLSFEHTKTSIILGRRISFMPKEYMDDRSMFIGSCIQIYKKRLLERYALIKVGDTYTGIVKSVCGEKEVEFVWVDINGFTGLIHGSRLINKQIWVGDYIFVKVIDIDYVKQRMNLSEELEQYVPYNTCKNTSQLREKSQGSAIKNNGNLASMSELNDLIGIQCIKRDVSELIGLVNTMKNREKRGLKTIPISLHLVFTGNPGTGKTTVARILAQLYKEIGVLSVGQLVEVDRSDLVAGYVGQTALKTQKKIDEAKGGILFIDEAYTLVKDGNDFGQEAIDTILKEMEDHRGEFIVVVAGYPESMKKFINSNPGLKSRFNRFFHFPDYNIEELEQIFNMFCEKYDYKLTEKARLKVREDILAMEQSKTDNFANARDIRNYFERIITKQANRIFAIENANEKDMLTIIPSDLQ